MQHKKRLVHIISSLKQGGAESLLIDLVRNLGEFEHHVIFFHDGPNRNRLQKIGIATYHIKGLICLYDPVFWFRLSRLVYCLKPQCIHSSLWAANVAARILAKILKIPLVCVVHLGVHQDGVIRNMIDRISFKLAPHVITVSQEIADTLQERSWIPAKQIHVIPNGIDVSAVRHQAQRNRVTKKEMGFDDDALIIGSVGRFIARKNHHLLIRAFAYSAAHHKKARLVLVGFGPTEHELRNLVAALGINDKIRFEIGKPAYGYYPLFDCFVLSSQQEGISIALLEALCFSLPCVVTSPTLYHEVIIAGHNGLVVPVNDESRLAESLSLFLRDAQLRQKLGATAFHTVTTQFGIQSMIGKYREVFTSAKFYN